MCVMTKYVALVTNYIIAELCTMPKIIAIAAYNESFNTFMCDCYFLVHRFIPIIHPTFHGFMPKFIKIETMTKKGCVPKGMSSPY